MYARILVAADGSEPSQRALDEAIRLGLDQHAQLRIVHVVDIAWMLTGEFIDIERVETDLRADAARILERDVATAKAAGVTTESALLETDGGTVAQAVIADAQGWHAELIVAGTHGRHGVAHLVLGSVAEGVVRSSRAPVLLLRAV